MISEPKQSLRHAEKARASSCTFADRIATCALDKYRHVVPAEVRSVTKQTVVAAVLAHSLATDEMQVVAIGMGTKFTDIAPEDPTRDLRLHDCHAEVLAKRAFRRFVAAEIGRLHASRECTGADFSIFQLCGENIVALKSGVSLHFYTSSQPCGNASVKRWGNGTVLDLHAEEQLAIESGATPNPLVAKLCTTPAPHAKLHIVQREQGQVALSMKMRSDVGGESAVATAGCSSGACGGMYLAPGTCEPGAPGGVTHTCSDKMATWNLLGLQGTPLSPFLATPLYMATVVIGRKGSELHARRAICCRLQELKSVATRARSAGESNDSQRRYRLNHPWILSTSVKLDESVKGQDERAEFDSPLCAAWCLGLADAEIIEGCSGWLANGGGPSAFCRARLLEPLSPMIGEELAADTAALKRRAREADSERTLLENELFTTVFSSWARHSQ